MSERVIGQEEAQPRFLLGAGPAPADAVAAVLAALEPAGLIVRGGLGRGWSEVARDHDVALLVEDDVELALDVDGVHLSDVGNIRNARERLGPDHLIGADVDLSRHDAMIAGEDGADYVAFGEQGGPLSPEIIDLIQWWQDVTVLPCLAYAADAEAAKKLADIGADFIGISSAVWDHPDGSAAAALELSAAISKI